MKAKQHKWTAEELQFIRDHLQRMSLVDLGKHFNVSYNSIRNKIRDMGLKNPKQTAKLKVNKRDREIGLRPTKYDVRINMNNFKPDKPVKDSTTGKIPLVINRKLTVFINPDQDPEKIRAKYSGRK